MFRFSDQVWKEMQMGEVVTILTSASGYSLVKSFSGTDITPQPFSTGKLFNVSEAEVLSHLAAGWGEGAITELKLEYLYGPEPEVSGE